MNFITQIEAFDGGPGYVNGQVGTQFEAETPLRDILVYLIKSLQAQGISQGAVGSYEGAAKRGTGYSGTMASVINGISGNGFFIDNNKANVLKDNEYIMRSDGQVLRINAQTGLLNTPVREVTLMYFDILFEPELFIGQKVKIETETGLKVYNGEFVVKSIHHKGTISPVVCGSATTTVSVLFGTKELVPVRPAS